MSDKDSATEAAGPIIGIDLGTTMSACGILVKGVPTLFENPLGQTLTPSVVAKDPRGAGLVVGRAAKDILALRPDLAAGLFKRDIGKDRKRKLGELEIGPVELSAYLLDALRSDAERALRTPVERCVVTVPAYFNEAQRFETKLAAELAGLRVERVLNEPTAAAIALGANESDDESTFLVFDLGGGTFDVCVMELFDGAFEVKSVAGESRLGGEDFTEALVKDVLKRLNVDPATAAETASYPLLFKRAELLKRRLATWSEASISVPPMDGQLDVETDLVVSATEAERAWLPLLDRMLAPCRAALRGAKLRPSELDRLILVGGATRLPCVQAFARKVFKQEPTIDPEPDLLVARGAAIQAALCARDEAVSDLVVTDVVSHSLGVATMQSRGLHYMSGVFAPVIHRNTVIPVSCHQQFSTTEDFQSAIEFEVFEGESRKVSENTSIGKLRVDRIPKELAGVIPVDVRFTLDLRGILEVEAYVAATDRVYAKVFHRHVGELKDKDIERARERMRYLKTNLAAMPRHREILARADLLWQESAPTPRHRLGDAIARFEDSLESGGRDRIAEAYQELHLLCDELDSGDRW